MLGEHQRKKSFHEVSLVLCRLNTCNTNDAYASNEQVALSILISEWALKTVVTAFSPFYVRQRGDRENARVHGIGGNTDHTKKKQGLPFEIASGLETQSAVNGQEEG